MIIWSSTKTEGTLVPSHPTLQILKNFARGSVNLMSYTSINEQPQQFDKKYLRLFVHSYEYHTPWTLLLRSSMSQVFPSHSPQNLGVPNRPWAPAATSFQMTWGFNQLVQTRHLHPQSSSQQGLKHLQMPGNVGAPLRKVWRMLEVLFATLQMLHDDRTLISLMGWHTLR